MGRGRERPGERVQHRPSTSAKGCFAGTDSSPARMEPMENSLPEDETHPAGTWKPGCSAETPQRLDPVQKPAGHENPARGTSPGAERKIRPLRSCACQLVPSPGEPAPTLTPDCRTARCGEATRPKATVSVLIQRAHGRAELGRDPAYICDKAGGVCGAVSRLEKDSLGTPGGLRQHASSERAGISREAGSGARSPTWPSIAAPCSGPGGALGVDWGRAKRQGKRGGVSCCRKRPTGVRWEPSLPQSGRGRFLASTLLKRCRTDPHPVPSTCAHALAPSSTSVSKAGILLASSLLRLPSNPPSKARQGCTDPNTSSPPLHPAPRRNAGLGNTSLEEQRDHGK